MQNVESNGSTISLEDHKIECSNLEKDQILMVNLPQDNKIENGQSSSSGDCPNNKDDLKIVISNGDLSNLDEPKLESTIDTKIDEVSDALKSPKKVCLSRNESSREQCRVCQQTSSEEALIDLGCHCRGGLAKAHLSCIGTWFSTRGSNKCEICQQIAVNVPPPESQPSRNYWIWRIDPTSTHHQRRCYSPLWVAFSILIGGLLLDVLISISLGVSALPVNIIIGVLVVLGLGTALRLAFECCQEISIRRAVQRLQNENQEYNSTIWQNL